MVKDPGSQEEKKQESRNLLNYSSKNLKIKLFNSHLSHRISRYVLTDSTYQTFKIQET